MTEELKAKLDAYDDGDAVALTEEEMRSIPAGYIPKNTRLGIFYSGQPKPPRPIRDFVTSVDMTNVRVYSTLADRIYEARMRTRFITIHGTPESFGDMGPDPDGKPLEPNNLSDGFVPISFGNWGDT